MEITRPPPVGLGPPANPPRSRADQAASDFEALLVTRLLKTARAAKLGDDLMGSSDQLRDQIDEQRGRLIARAAPLGLAQLLAKGSAP